MRFLILALLCLILSACASSRGQGSRQGLTSVEIQEVKPRYIEAEPLTRISDYFSAQENKGNRIFLRSTPEARSGYYFVLILDKQVRRLPLGTTVTGEFYTPNQIAPQTFAFTLPNRRPKTKEIFVGLTGDDWPDADSIPAAWRFTIKDPNGEILGQSQSFLWSL